MMNLFSLLSAKRLTALLLASAVVVSVVACEESLSNPIPQAIEFPMAQDNIQPSMTHADIARIFGTPPRVKIQTTVEELKAKCQSWKEPAPPDEMSHSWYRAATNIYVKRIPPIEEYQQMLQLFEAAARKGHYGAVKALTIIYSDGARVKGARFKPEPMKARFWIEYGLKQKWVGALEWVADAVSGGGAGFEQNSELGQRYLYQAADQGSALAQYQLALMYGNRYRKVELEKALLECAVQGELSVALYDLAGYRKINEAYQEALELYQRAVMTGGDGGALAAFRLYSAFLGGRDQKGLGLTEKDTDEERSKRYREIQDATSLVSRGNPFLKFPRLNEVLPLPPEKLGEWDGIYSAMSEDDAKYYQNPLPPEHYIEEIKQHGVLVPVEYLSQPVMDEK